MNILIKDILSLLEENGQYKMQEATLYIEGDKIVGINNYDGEFVPEVTIDGRNKLAIPGLINAHTHSYMSLLRNCADDVPFTTWLFDTILPMEDQLTGEDCYWGSMLGIMEMLRTGTTCFSDMYMFINETSRAVEETGIRACLARGLVGDGVDEGGFRRIREAREEIEYWKTKNNDRIHFLVAPHAPYSCNDKYLTQVIEFAKEYELGIHIHLAEGRNEIKEIAEKYHCTPMELMEKLGVFDLPTIAAHCVHLTEQDMEIMAKKRVSVATCPVSNLKLGNGFAPIARLMEHGVNICMGTDGAASNNTLNMFKELQFVSLIHKGKEEKADVVAASDGLRFATANGAKALGLEKVGKLEVGYKADVTILDIDKPQFYPRNNLISALAYSANGDEVTTVIVDGKILMENGEYKTLDEERIKFETDRIIKRIRS